MGTLFCCIALHCIHVMGYFYSLQGVFVLWVHAMDDLNLTFRMLSYLGAYFNLIVHNNFSIHVV